MKGIILIVNHYCGPSYTKYVDPYDFYKLQGPKKNLDVISNKATGTNNACSTCVYTSRVHQCINCTFLWSVTRLLSSNYLAYLTFPISLQVLYQQDPTQHQYHVTISYRNTVFNIHRNIGQK